MRIARLVSVVPVDRVDETWQTLTADEAFSVRLEKTGGRGGNGYPAESRSGPL